MKKLLCALLALLLLSGCGDGAAEAGEDLSESKYAYLAEYLEFDVEESEGFQGVEHACVSGNRVFFSGSCVTGTRIVTDEATGAEVRNRETGEPVEAETTETALFRMDLDTGGTVRLDYAPPEPPEGMLGTAWIETLAAGADGTFWLLERMNTYFYDLPEDFDPESGRTWDYYAEGESLAILSQYDPEGRLLQTVDVSAIGKSSAGQVLVDGSGNFYLNDYNHGEILLLDAAGNLLVRLDNAACSSLCQIGPAEIGVMAFSSGAVFRLIDPEIPGYGGEWKLPVHASMVCSGTEEYPYLYEDDSGGVYGFREETGEYEKLFSWLDCDVDRNTFDRFTMLEDGGVAAITQDFSGSSVQYGLLSMKRVDPSELPEKRELTLATMSAINVRDAVLAFNRSHSSVRIVVKDYSVYDTSEDMTAGLTRLNTEILAGKAPDLICTFGLPVDQYVARGYLTDLWPLIDGDEELSREDLMTHLFDVVSIDGGLYQVMDQFGIWTAVGDANVIGDRTGWTLEELVAYMDAMEDSSAAFGPVSSKQGVLSFCVGLNFEDFIDWENQTCSFDSQEFRDILNFANAFPSEYREDGSETVYDRFLAGKQLLINTCLLRFEEMQVLAAETGGNPCYVGFPSSTGSGSAFYISGGLAITAACQDVDAAWSFVRTLLTEAYQISRSDGFPTNRHAFEKMADRSKKIDSGTTYVDEGMAIRVKTLSQADYDTFLRLYASCDRLFTSNSVVYPIIAQEAEPFFDGQKTIDEAAGLIQNRVELYVMEQK